MSKVHLNKGKLLYVPAPAPAPGDLEKVQAFVNTASPGAEADELANPGELARWLVGHGLLDADVSPVWDDLQRAIETREGLRALLAVNNGFKVDGEAVRCLKDATATARFRIHIDEDNQVTLEPASRNVDDALGALLGFVAESRLEGLWPHFKACALAECLRAFFDASRSRTGRWCTRRCGDRERSRAFRRTAKYRTLHRSRI